MTKQYNTMDYQISEEKYNEIEQMIASEESVVGIDAKETHIIIIHMLQDLKQRVEFLEQRLDNT